MESNVQLHTQNEQIINCKELEAHPEIVEMKYINILKEKDEMLVFIDENSYHPIEIIQLDSFERILQLLGKNLNEGIDLVMFRFHSIDEIKEFKQRKKNSVGKENDYEFKYQKELNLNLVKCNRLKIAEVCFDNLWIVENELNKIKEREKVKNNEPKENKLQEEQKERDRLQKEEKEKLIREQEEIDRLKKEQKEKDRLKKEQEEKDKLKKEQEEINNKLKKEQEEKDKLKKKQEERDRLQKEKEEKDMLKKDKEYNQSRTQNKETKTKINSTNVIKKQIQNKPKTQSQTNHKQPKTVTKIISTSKKPNQTTNSKPTSNNQNFKKQPLITSTNHSKPKNLFPETKRVETETETKTTNSIKPFSKQPITARPKPHLKLLLNPNPLKTKPKNKHQSSSTKKDSSITELDSTLELNYQPLNTITSTNPVATKKRTHKASSMDTKQTIPKTNKCTPLGTLQQFITSAPASNSIYPTHTQYNGNKKTPRKPISSITTNSYPINSHCVICKGLPVRPKECIQCHKQYCLLCTYELKQYNHCDECNGLITHIQSNSNTINQTYEANITRNNKIGKSNESKKNKIKHLNLSAVEYYNNNRDRYFTEEWRQTLENDNKYHSRINSVENNRHNNNKADTISQLDTISNSNQKKAYHHLNKSLDLPEHKQTVLPSLIKRAPIQKLIDKTKMKDTSTFKSFVNKQHSAVYKYFKGNIIEKKLTTNQNDSILSICYIPSFSFKKDAILTGHSSGDIFMWDINKGNKIKIFCEHISKVYDLKLLQFNNNKSSFKINFISISEDKTIKIWDSSSQHSLLSISQLYPIYCIDNINSTSFITGDKNKNIYIHQFNINSNNITKGMMIKKHIEQHSAFIWRVLVLKKLNKTNKHYFISSSKNNLILHQLSGDQINKQIDNIHTYKEAHDGLIKDITELSFGKFASCGVDNTIKIWEYNKINCIHIITDLFEKSNNSLIYCLLYLNDYDIQSKEDVIICCGNENKVKVIGLNGKDIVIYGEFIRPESVHKVKLLTNNGKFKFMSINNNNNLYLWGLTNE